MSSRKSEINLVAVEASTSQASETCRSVSTLQLGSPSKEHTNCSLKSDADKSNSVRDISIKKQIKLKKYFLKSVDHLVRLMINMHIGLAALDQELYQDILSELFKAQKTITSTTTAELDPDELNNVNERLQTVQKNIQDIRVNWIQHYIETLNEVAQQCQELIKLFDDLKKNHKKQSTLESNVIEFLNYTLAKKKSLYKLNETLYENDICSESFYNIDQVLERIKLLQKRLNEPFSIDYGHVPKLFGDSAKKEMKRKEKQRKRARKKDAKIGALISGSRITNNNINETVSIEKYVGKTDNIDGQPDGENSLKITLKEGNAVNTFSKFSKPTMDSARVENELSKSSFMKTLRRVFSKNTFIAHGNINNSAQVNKMSIDDIKKQLQSKYVNLQTKLELQINQRRQFKINNIDSLILVIMMVLACVL